MRKKKAEKFFQKIQGKNFSSTRVKEIQLHSNLRLNNQIKAKELAESLSYKDLNLKNYNIREFSSSPEILNLFSPIRMDWQRCYIIFQVGTIKEICTNFLFSLENYL